MKSRVGVSDTEGHWCEEQSWEDTEKPGTRVKERKGAGCGREGWFLFHVPSAGLLTSSPTGQPCSPFLSPFHALLSYTNCSETSLPSVRCRLACSLGQWCTAGSPAASQPLVGGSRLACPPGPAWRVREETCGSRKCHPGGTSS